MVGRLFSLLVLGWLFGFVWFAVALPLPHPGGRTEAVIVLTGGAGRIEHAVAVLRESRARKLLVSGVDREVRPREFAAEYAVPARLMRCCVNLDFDAVDTRSNAREAVRWLADNRVRSARIVTSDWHMRRALFEIGRAHPRGVELVPDSVATKPSLRILFLEYHKLLARWLQALWQR